MVGSVPGGPLGAASPADIPLCRGGRGCRIYRGVCIDTACSLGMCAERSAVAAMLTCGEYHITHLVAFMPNGKPGLPCGACRELLMQLGPQSRDIQILLDEDTLDTVTLGQLVGDWWGDSRFAE